MTTPSVLSNNGVKSERDKVDYHSLYDTDTVDDKYSDHYKNSHHHKSHHTKDSLTKKVKDNHYIELDPRYNETHKYFEVFLPKTEHKDDPRIIYINVDKENNEFLLYDNEKHREINYRPIKLGLKELSAIADVIFSKSENGNNVFTVNDENVEGTEKYEINHVNYEVLNKEKGSQDKKSFDSEANTAPTNNFNVIDENDSIEHSYNTELNEADFDNHDSNENHNANNYFNIDSKATNDLLPPENKDVTNANTFTDIELSGNNDTKVYTNSDIVENNQIKSFTNYGELHKPVYNEDLDEDTLKQLEDKFNIDKVTTPEDNNIISNEGVYEISLGASEQQLKEDEYFRRSQAFANFAPVHKYNPRFDNICTNQAISPNPSKLMQPNLGISLPVSNALDKSMNIPSNRDSCVKSTILSLPNSNPCDLVTKPCIYSFEESILPNDFSKEGNPHLSPKQNLFALPNAPCSSPSNTIGLPNQNSFELKTGSPIKSFMSNSPLSETGNVFIQPNTLPSKYNENFLPNSATVYNKNGIRNSLSDLNSYVSYNPSLQNTLLKPSMPAQEFSSKPCLNKNILSNSYPKLSHFGTKPMSALNHPCIKSNLLPNSLSYPQILNQKSPCLPYSYQDQNSHRVAGNTQKDSHFKYPLTNGLNLPPSFGPYSQNNVAEPSKQYKPFNINLSLHEDSTIDPTKYGYLTVAPYFKFTNIPTKPCTPSFKIPADTNQGFDVSKESLLDSSLTGANLSFSTKKDNQKFPDKSTVISSIQHLNLDSSLTGPHLDLGSSPYLSYSSNFDNVNALSDTDLKSFIELLSQCGNSMNGMGVKNLAAPESLDTTLIGSGLDLNGSPCFSSTGSFFDSSLIGPGLNVEKPPTDSTLFSPNLELNGSSGLMSGTGIASSNVSPTCSNKVNTLNTNQQSQLLKRLDSTLLGPNLNLDKSNLLRPFDVSPHIDPNVCLNTLPGSYSDSNISPAYFNKINAIENSESVALQPLDSTLKGSKLNLMSDTFISSGVLPSNINLINSAGDQKLKAEGPVDSLLVGPELNTEKSLVSPQSIKDEMQFSNQNESPSLALDSSLLDPSLKTLPLEPTLENRVQTMNDINKVGHNVNDNYNAVDDNVTQLQEKQNPLQLRIGVHSAEQSSVDDTPNKVDSSNTIETNGDVDNNFNAKGNESPPPNTNNINIPYTPETQKDNLIYVVNTTDEVELTNTPNDTYKNSVTPKATDMSQTGLDLKSARKDLESYDKFKILGPSDLSPNEISNLNDSVTDSGLDKDLKAFNGEEGASGTDKVQVITDGSAQNDNIGDKKETLESRKHNTIDNEAKLVTNPEDYVVSSTPNIKDDNLFTETDAVDKSSNSFQKPIEEINVTQKTLVENAARHLNKEHEEFINNDSDKEPYNLIKDKYLDQVNDSQVTFNKADDSRNVVIEESRTKFPNDDITVIDSSVLDPSLELSKKIPLNLIGGKIDSNFIAPSLLQGNENAENVPDSIVNNCLFQDQSMENNARFNSYANVESSLLSPGLNLDKDLKLDNNVDGDRFNLATHVNFANNLVEDGFLDHSLTVPALAVEGYTPFLVDNPLEYLKNSDQIQQAKLSKLNTANAMDSSVKASDLVTLPKNTETNLAFKTSPEPDMTRFTPQYFNIELDQSTNNAPLEYAPYTLNGRFLFGNTVTSNNPYVLPTWPILPSLARPCVSPTPILPFSSIRIPYSKVPSSYPPPTYSNVSPCTTNEYPPLFLPARKPYPTIILPSQNLPGIVPNTFLPKLQSDCSNSKFTDVRFPSVTGSNPLVTIPGSQLYRPDFVAPSSLPLPFKSLIKDNSFTLTHPYTNSWSPSDIATPKLPEAFINTMSTISSPPSSPCVDKNDISSSVQNIVPQTLTSTPSFDVQSLKYSPTFQDEGAMRFLPQTLSFLDQEHPSEQSITSPNSLNQISKPQYVSLPPSNLQKPLYANVDSLSANGIKELITQLPSSISSGPIFRPYNYWANPLLNTPVQNFATTVSSTLTSSTPEFSKLLIQTPVRHPYSQILSNEYVPSLSKGSLSMPSSKPESDVTDSDNEYKSFHQILSLLQESSSDPTRDPHITYTLPLNTANSLPTSILNFSPDQTEFKLQSPSLVPCTNPIDSLTYNDRLKILSADSEYFLGSSSLNTMPQVTDEKQKTIPNLQNTEVNNNLQIYKETRNEIEHNLERDKQSRSIPHFEANLIPELKELMYSVKPNNINMYFVDERTPIAMASPMPCATPLLGANTLSSVNTNYNLPPVDFKPYTIDDKSEIPIPISTPSSRPYVGVNNLNSFNPMYSLTPNKYMPCGFDEKAPISLTSPVTFARPYLAANTRSPVNRIAPSLLSHSNFSPLITKNKPLPSIFATKSSAQPLSNEFSPYSPVTDTNLAPLPSLNEAPNIESSSVPLVEPPSITNLYSSTPDNISIFPVESSILPNHRLAPLNLVQSQIEPSNPTNKFEDTLPETDIFKWSDINLEGFKPYVDDTEANLAETGGYGDEDSRLVYSNDLFDNCHEGPFIIEPKDSNYVQEERDLLPSASLNRDVFSKAVPANPFYPPTIGIPQNMVNNLPIETKVPYTKYATPITTLSSPVLKPLSLALSPTYKSNLDKLNLCKMPPTSENLIPSSTPSLTSPGSTKLYQTLPIQYAPVSPHTTFSSYSFPSPNTASSPTVSFNSYLPKAFSQSSPSTMTGLLPNNLQYSPSFKPCQALPVSIKPYPSSESSTLEATPFISSSQIKQYPVLQKTCSPNESKLYVPQNKALYPSSHDTPSQLLASDTNVPPSTTPYKAPKITSFLTGNTPLTTVLDLLSSQPTPDLILNSILPSQTDPYLHRPSYKPQTLPVPLFSSFENKPLLTSSIESPYTSPTSFYSHSAAASSPFTQRYPLFPNAPSKTTSIYQDGSSRVAPYTKPYISNNAAKTNNAPYPLKPYDLNENLKVLSSIQSPALDTAYPGKVTLPSAKNPFISSSVCPTKTLPSLQLPNEFNNYISSRKPNPNTFSVTDQAPTLTSPNPSSYTFYLPVNPIQNSILSVPMKITSQNLPFSSDNPNLSTTCRKSLLAKTESFNNSPRFNPTPSKPFRLDLLGNIQSNEVSQLSFTSPILSSYNLIKAPPSKPPPCMPAYLPNKFSANTPINSPILSTPLATAKLYTPIFEPITAPCSRTYSPTLPYTIPQFNTEPSHLTQVFPSNVWSNSMQSQPVSHTHSSSPYIPLYSNSLSSLTDKPLICTEPKPLPSSNPQYQSVTRTPAFAPSLKSPCMQKLFPTMYEFSSTVSPSTQSPMISSISNSSSSKSPAVSLKLAQSPPFRTPSDFPRSTAYNLPSPNPVLMPPFFFTPQGYSDQTQTPTPSIASNSQPYLQPKLFNNQINPIPTAEFLTSKSKIQGDEDFINLGDLNNLPNELNGFKPYDIEEKSKIEEDIEAEERFNTAHLYTEDKNLYDFSEKEFDNNTNDGSSKDITQYTDEDRQIYDEKYLIDNNYIVRKPIETLQNEDKISNLDLKSKPTEYYNSILKPNLLNEQENKLEFANQPLINIDDSTLVTYNRNPIIENNNANYYYTETFNIQNKPVSMNLKQINLYDFDLNRLDFQERPSIDNIKYSGYKTYQMPLRNPKNTSPLIYITPTKLNSGLKYNPTNVCSTLQKTLIQPEINLNNVDLSTKLINKIPEMEDLKDSLVKYINKNAISDQNDEITIPIAVIDTTPVTVIQDNKENGLNLKMWKSKVKIVNAEIKLKCKEITFNNFMPIVIEDKFENYRDVVKQYIEDKYGRCLIMDKPYTQENRYSVLNSFEPKDVDNNFNLLWPNHCKESENI
ncbi:hypothetical protein HF086_008993 [Spodoptera exigua]|uniref:Uncharacterized protein n=1 Tax=Spodoptera exigua TaxID=7107 RepID=A0A922MM03_SPOEX|nr:hypothetical protein HF086_008993 [Spodoptera exigua]